MSGSAEPLRERRALPERVLVIDDDPKLRGYIRQGLEESGVACRTAASAEEAARELAESPGAFDLFLLDVMMPGRSGWEMLAELRAGGDQTPVIFLTARQGVEDRVRGLQLGADDYVIKPFELRELLARMEAVHRRRRPLSVLEVADLRIDLARRVVERGGERIEMSPREFDLLHALARAPGRVMSRAELLKEAWGIDFDPGTNLVDVQVARLRRKLHRAGPPVIHTVIGEGYRLGDPVEDEAA